MALFQKGGAWDQGGWGTPLSKIIPLVPEVNEDIDQPQALASPYSGGWGYTSPVYPMVYDGEKNLGEVGPIYQYFLDYYRLKLRSRQLYVESDIAKSAIDKYKKWVIGKGLTLNAEPQVDVLKSEGITLDPEAFNDSVESRWKVYANSKMADITGRKTLNELEAEACAEEAIGGDILVLLVVVGSTVKIRHIDGGHVITPPTLSFNGADYMAQNGNRVRMGVEIDASGKHVAYYIRKDYASLECIRIEAIDRKSGMTVAYLSVNEKYTIDSERGMPKLISAMETTKKMERYTSAALGGAEERQKIPIFFEHGQTSTNEDPLLGRRAKALAGRGDLKADLAVDVEGNKKAAEVAVSTNKTVINLPNDVTIKSIDSTQEMNVPEFGNFNIDLIAAAITMPSNVLLSKYEDSFSASRMSGKDWEHTFLTQRQNFSQRYLSPIYALQVYVWVLSNKLQAPGYLTAYRENNEFAMQAYLHCAWNGDMFPDIDPLKTANYLRTMLGPTLAHMPLMTTEAAAEYMNQGGSNAILQQTAKDLKLAESLGIKPVMVKGQVPDEPEDKEEKPKD